MSIFFNFFDILLIRVDSIDIKNKRIDFFNFFRHLFVLCRLNRHYKLIKYKIHS